MINKQTIDIYNGKQVKCFQSSVFGPRYILYAKNMKYRIIVIGLRHGHGRMVVGFTTTCAISAYCH
jgi:hypothetical protein